MYERRFLEFRSTILRRRNSDLTSWSRTRLGGLGRREAGGLTGAGVCDAHRGLDAEFSDVAVGDLIGLAADMQR